MSWDEDTIWSKVCDPPAVEASLNVKKDSSPQNETSWIQKHRRTRRFWITTRTIATIGWLYAITKVFVGDFDTAVAKAIGPWAESVVTYRLVGVAIALVIVLSTVRRPFQPILYVAFFPLVVLFSFLPRLLLRVKSWITFLAATNVAATLFRHFARNVLLLLLGLLAVFVIMVVSSPPWLYGAVVTLGGVGGYVYFRYLVSSFKGSEFLRVQMALIKRMYKSNGLRNFTTVDVELRHPDIELFTGPQQEAFLQKVSYGLIAYNTLYFWAYQIDQYRRSSMPAVFAALSHAWLLLSTVFLLTFMNLGLDRADLGAFSGGRVTFLSMMRYSVASLYGGEITGVAPQSQLTEGLAVTAMLGAGLIVLTIVIGFLQSRWTQTQSRLFEQTIDSIRMEAQGFRQRFEGEFAKSPTEALSRLEELRYGLVAWIAAVTERVPSDFQADLDGTTAT